MTAETVTAQVTTDDVDAALAAFLLGTRIHFSCPVQRALQRTVERIAVVYQFTWHLEEQKRGKDVVLATKGVDLPETAIAFVKRFDAWARAVRDQLLAQGGGDVDRAAEAVKPSRPGPFSFTVQLPTEPIREAKTT